MSLWRVEHPAVVVVHVEADDAEAAITAAYLVARTYEKLDFAASWVQLEDDLPRVEEME